jgi:hypothetical protein
VLFRNHIFLEQRSALRGLRGGVHCGAWAIVIDFQSDHGMVSTVETSREHFH